MRVRNNQSDSPFVELRTFKCYNLINETITSFLRVQMVPLRSFVILFILLVNRPLYSQEMLGIVNSNYAGITGSVINPAVAVTSPFYIDINLVAGDFFAGNNYVYIAKEDYRFSRFLSRNPEFPTHGTDNNMIVYDYYNTKDKKAFSSNRVMGPSFAITVGRHAFGIVTGARAVMSTKNIPYDIAKFAFERRDFTQQYGINYNDKQKIYNAELAWAEVGINYSYVFKQSGADYWAAGITVKDLMGHSGGYLYSTNIDYIVPNRDSLVINNLNGEAGYSLPLDYETSDYIKDPLFRGKGLGFDIGVIYQKKKQDVQEQDISKLCDQNYTPYIYKIGVSLLDIGRVRFTQNAEKLVFDNVSADLSNMTYMGYTSMNDLTELLSNEFYGNPSELIKGNEIKIALPTALSVQADVNVRKNWYVNGTLVHPLHFTKSGLIRPVIIAVTPRYETALFDISMPVSLFDWTEPRIGLSARFLWFFVGTEKLSGFFHYKDFTGLDFYFGAKISLRKGHCRNNTSRGNSGNKRMGNNCGIEEYKMFQKQDKL